MVHAPPSPPPFLPSAIFFSVPILLSLVNLMLDMDIIFVVVYFCERGQASHRPNFLDNICMDWFLETDAKKSSVETEGWLQSCQPLHTGHNLLPLNRLFYAIMLTMKS